MDITSYYQVQDVFTSEECDRIVETYSKKYLHKGSIISGTRVQSRKSKILWIEFAPETEWIYKKLYEVSKKINEEKYKFNMDNAAFEKIQFTQYNEGDHYEWHIDTGPMHTSFRKISITVQLSDPEKYEGGQLQIGVTDELAQSAIQDKGSVTIFPSIVRHRVTPVTKGTRYSLVAWVCGPPFC